MSEAAEEALRRSVGEAGADRWGAGEVGVRGHHPQVQQAGRQEEKAAEVGLKGQAAAVEIRRLLKERCWLLHSFEPSWLDVRYCWWPWPVPERRKDQRVRQGVAHDRLLRLAQPLLPASYEEAW